MGSNNDFYYSFQIRDKNMASGDMTLPLVTFKQGDEAAKNSKFHEESLSSALYGFEEYRLLIVSVTGVFRSGKSFLMNLMVTFLQHLSEKVGCFYLSVCLPCVIRIRSGI